MLNAELKNSSGNPSAVFIRLGKKREVFWNNP